MLTYKFLEKIEPRNVRYNVLSPYPGSAFYEELAPKGLIDAKDYEDFDVVRTPVTGKGIIKGVDYNLVMKWRKPFTSFKEASLLVENNHPVLAKAVVSAGKAAFLPLPSKILATGFDFFGEIYLKLKKS